MNLHEYQAKRLFAEHGIPIPNGDIATTPAEARAVAERLGGGVVVKAQVHIGGRGKAGGVKLAKTADEAAAHATDILGMDIKGHKVRRVLVDELAPGGIAQEIYLAILIDRAARQHMIMASAAGGMDIEQVAEETPDKIHLIHLSPETAVSRETSDDLAQKLGFEQGLWDQFFTILSGLYTCFVEKDASLMEINPLVITGEGQLMAVDGKVSLDDNALGRQPKLLELRDLTDEPESERFARKSGITFIKLEGNIGCMVNGAGLAMATMDTIKAFGAEKGCAPANFLDIGGGAKAEQVAAALSLILSDENVKAVLFNIFGGITRGDEVARGILSALEKIDTDVPMVIRLAGTNAKEGLEILAEADMETAVTLSDAAHKAVAAALAGGQG